MDFKEAIGAIVAGVALLVPAIKWLISDWAKKSTELEELKRANQAAALNRFNDDVRDFRIAIDGIQAQIKELASNLTMNRKEIINLEEKLADTAKLLATYTSAIDDKVKNMIKSEITNLTQKLMLIRSKKNGQ